MAGEAGGVRPTARLLGVENLTAPTGLLVGVDLAGGGRVLLGAALGAAALVTADSFAAELLLFAVDVGLVGSGFLAAAAAAAVDVAGFLAAAAGGGRPTSFRAAAVLGAGTAVVLPPEGAVVALGTVGLAVAELLKGFEAAVVGREGAEAGLDVEEPVVGLVVFGMTAAPGLGAAEVEGFAAVYAKGLLVAPGFLGLAPPTASGPVFFLAVLLADVGLVPLAAALVAEVVLACPTGLLSGTLV